MTKITFNTFEYNENVFIKKNFFIRKMITDIRTFGGIDFWVFNKKNNEIYYFKATQISDFDVQIDISNALLKEHLFTGIFVLHMKENILNLLEEVSGSVYLKKLECYRDLYKSLCEKVNKNNKNKNEIIEIIEFIENEFPQFVM